MHFHRGHYLVRFIFCSLHHLHALMMPEACIRSHPKASQLLGSLMDGLQRLGAKVASRTCGAERTGRTLGGCIHLWSILEDCSEELLSPEASGEAHGEDIP